MTKPMKLSEANADFFDRVYQIVQLIPKGRATSYGAIAKCLGTKSGSRMVGWAMNAAHGLENIPAQRVVNRNGLLTGKMHFETPTRMEELLKLDGIGVMNDQILNWKEVFWDPMTEINID
jgi:methylated-DNA-protein-cysteine methyltransferase related protein